MWNWIKGILIALIAKFLGYKKIDPEERSRQREAKESRESEYSRQLKEWALDTEEWNKASDDEKRDILLNRFKRPSDRT